MDRLTRLFLTATMVIAAGRPAMAENSGIRHISQQFGAWSLACNENTVSKGKACSVSQDVLGNGGALAFHWELSDAPGEKTRAVILLAPLLSNSVIVLRTGAIGTIVDQVKCTPAQCTGTTVLPEASLNILRAGGTSTAQFIYMNAVGSVITLSGKGFSEAWQAMRAELPGKEMMTGSIKPRKVAGEARAAREGKDAKPAFAPAATVTTLAEATRFH